MPSLLLKVLEQNSLASSLVPKTQTMLILSSPTRHREEEEEVEEELEEEGRSERSTSARDLGAGGTPLCLARCAAVFKLAAPGNEYLTLSLKSVLSTAFRRAFFYFRTLA